MKNFLYIFKLICLLCFTSSLLESGIEETFSKIYSQGIWAVNNSGEGTSGTGSTPEAAKKYINFVNNFIKQKQIKSVLDIGCGDGQIIKLLNIEHDMSYIGVDVVKNLIQKNRINFPRFEFLHLNVVEDELPVVDLVLCKDVLQHLSNDQILVILNKIKKVSKYALLTNDFENRIGKTIMHAENLDIEPGSYRCIDLSKPPFNCQGKVVFKYKCPTPEKKAIYLIKGEN